MRLLQTTRFGNASFHFIAIERAKQQHFLFQCVFFSGENG